MPGGALGNRAPRQGEHRRDDARTLAQRDRTRRRRFASRRRSQPTRLGGCGRAPGDGSHHGGCGARCRRDHTAVASEDAWWMSSRVSTRMSATRCSQCRQTRLGCRASWSRRTSGFAGRCAGSSRLSCAPRSRQRGRARAPSRGDRGCLHRVDPRDDQDGAFFCDRGHARPSRRLEPRPRPQRSRGDAGLSISIEGGVGASLPASLDPD